MTLEDAIFQRHEVAPHALLQCVLDSEMFTREEKKALPRPNSLNWRGDAMCWLSKLDSERLGALMEVPVIAK